MTCPHCGEPVTLLLDLGGDLMVDADAVSDECVVVLSAEHIVNAVEMQATPDRLRCDSCSWQFSGVNAWTVKP